MDRCLRVVQHFYPFHYCFAAKIHRHSNQSSGPSHLFVLTKYESMGGGGRGGRGGGGRTAGSTCSVRQEGSVNILTTRTSLDQYIQYRLIVYPTVWPGKYFIQGLLLVLMQGKREVLI